MANGYMALNGNGIVATANFTDDTGAPQSLLPGVVPQWAVKDPALVAVTPDKDGLTAVLRPLAIGSTSISVTAKSDPNSGQSIITQTDQITVGYAAATKVDITFTTVP